MSSLFPLGEDLAVLAACRTGSCAKYWLNSAFALFCGKMKGHSMDSASKAYSDDISFPTPLVGWSRSMQLAATLIPFYINHQDKWPWDKGKKNNRQTVTNGPLYLLLLLTLKFGEGVSFFWRGYQNPLHCKGEEHNICSRGYLCPFEQLISITVRNYSWMLLMLTKHEGFMSQYPLSNPLSFGIMYF